jgi:membrane protein
MNAMGLYHLLKDTFHEWNEDKAPRLGAALAYYSVFSIGPLVVLVIGAASLIFGAQAAQREVVDEIKGTVGEPVAKALQDMLAHGHESGWGTGATILGIVTLLFGATGVFGQLQDALNTVWKVAPKPDRGILGIIQDRFLSLTMVLGTGFLLLVSLILLFGAELTRVYAEQYGSGMKPTPNAVPLTAEARARQGMPWEEELHAAARGEHR